eukprot:scpid104359/ scgid3279/ 
MKKEANSYMSMDHVFTNVMSACSVHSHWSSDKTQPCSHSHVHHQKQRTMTQPVTFYWRTQVHLSLILSEELALSLSSLCYVDLLTQVLVQCTTVYMGVTAAGQNYPWSCLSRQVALPAGILPAEPALARSLLW